MTATLNLVNKAKPGRTLQVQDDEKLGHDHPDLELLEQFAMKHCSKDVGEAVKRHLTLCDSCRAEYSVGEEWIMLMKSALRQ